MCEAYRSIGLDEIEEVATTQSCFDFVDPVFAEQIEISLRVMSEASTLPPHIVDHHRKILEYWGVIDGTLI